MSDEDKDKLLVQFAKLIVTWRDSEEDPAWIFRRIRKEWDLSNWDVEELYHQARKILEKRE